MSDPVEIVADELRPWSYGPRDRYDIDEQAHDALAALHEAGWRIVRTVDDPDAAVVAPLEAWITEEWTP